MRGKHNTGALGCSIYVEDGTNRMLDKHSTDDILCEPVDWHSGATGLQRTISPLEQDGSSNR